MDAFTLNPLSWSPTSASGSFLFVSMLRGELRSSYYLDRLIHDYISRNTILQFFVRLRAASDVHSMNPSVVALGLRQAAGQITPARFAVERAGAGRLRSARIGRPRDRSVTRWARESDGASGRRSRFFLPYSFQSLQRSRAQPPSGRGNPRRGGPLPAYSGPEVEVQTAMRPEAFLSRKRRADSRRFGQGHAEVT